ncbi:MAG TPA: carboxypeptidase-like regulatory domain-containing protein, partial [Candidatus Limnocylindrales bacterium]|nr:carboxypeptidase-like regulatory domain-containing protein [Candidatus Limnocylindrales bacterium]
MKKAVPSLFVLIFLCAAPLRAQTDTGSLEGTVVNAQNERVIPRATVLARNVKNASDVTSVRADDSGHFAFTNLKAGAYRITAEQQSFYVDPHRRIFQPVVEVAAGELRSGVVVRLQPTAVVTGQIVDEHNDPMEHVQVKLLAREYHKGRLSLTMAGLGLTDDRGEYRIYDVRPGNYYLLAEVNPALRKKGVEVIATTGMTGVIDRSGLRKEDGGPVPPAPYTFPPQFFPSTRDFLDATSLPIHPGDETHGDFVMFSTPSVSVSGVVLNGMTGDRVNNAAVAAYWTDIFGGAGGNIAATSKPNG